MNAYVSSVARWSCLTIVCVDIAYAMNKECARKIQLPRKSDRGQT